MSSSKKIIECLELGWEWTSFQFSAQEEVCMGKIKYYCQNREFLTIEQMNELLADCVAKDKDVLGKAIGLKFKQCCVIQESKIKLVVSTEYKGKLKDYYTFLDGRDDPEMTDGGRAYANLKMAWPQIPEITDLPETISASPMIGYNNKYNKKRQKAWGYDLNSAYASAMIKGWIDTTQPPEAKVIEEGEVGFDLNLNIVRSGFAPFVFQKMETPPEVVAWVKKWYQRKKEAKNKKDKLLAKQTLNYAVGMLQIKNPWLRAWIVGGCNEVIKALIDKDTLFWNTDSIVSRRPRPDLTIGNEIGEWKLEHEGEVAYWGNAYQWNNDTPTYRGVPKGDFPEGWDILKDDTPKHSNPYYFDEEEMKICQVSCIGTYQI